MRTLLATFLFAALFGCQPPEPPVVHAPSATSDQGSTSGIKTAGGTEVVSDPSSKPDPSTNPYRLFQLKDLARVTIKVNKKPIPVWVMDNEEKRAEGMMFLKEKEVKPEEGMIFVFPQPQEAGRGFWMHNTFLPLDIIYISADKKVEQIAHGKPQDDTNLTSKKAFQYVLELRAGGAERLKIVPGSLVELPGPMQKAAK